MNPLLKHIAVFNAPLVPVFALVIKTGLWCDERGVTPWLSVPMLSVLTVWLYLKLAESAARRWL